MGINYRVTKKSGREIKSIGYDVAWLSSNTKNIMELVPSRYDGEDSRIFFNSVEQLQRELHSISDELVDLGERIINTAEEIRMEEEEQERKKREERERLELLVR